jgi:hypothetical protein
MLVTFELPAELNYKLQTQADLQKIPLSKLIEKLLHQLFDYELSIEDRKKQYPSADDVQCTTLSFQTILDSAMNLGISDLAEQHDHYLYGIDKK